MDTDWHFRSLLHCCALFQEFYRRETKVETYGCDSLERNTFSMDHGQLHVPTWRKVTEEEVSLNSEKRKRKKIKKYTFLSQEGAHGKVKKEIHQNDTIFPHCYSLRISLFYEKSISCLSTLVNHKIEYKTG